MATQIFHFSNTGISSGQRFYLKDEVSGIFLRNLNINSNFPIFGSNLVYNTGSQTINGLKTFTTGIDIYNGTSPQSIRVFNSTGTNSGEFGLFGWRNNNLIIGSQQTTSGILRDLTLTGANININASSALNIFDNTNIVGDLLISGNATVTNHISAGGYLILQNPTGIPLTTGSPGIRGSIVWDTGFLYVCTNTNSWVRTALNTW